MGLVFVGGVHGVGKSFVCIKVAEELGLRVHSASGIIMAERGALNPDYGKTVFDVPENQRLLIHGLRRTLAGSDRVQLLDGHFALRSLAENIECINVEVFEQLGIRHLVCFHDDPASILGRLQQRDGYKGELGDIASLQEKELRHAEFVALRLGLSLYLIQAFDSSALRELLMRAMTEGRT